MVQSYKRRLKVWMSVTLKIHSNFTTGWSITPLKSNIQLMKNVKDTNRVMGKVGGNKISDLPLGKSYNTLISGYGHLRWK